MHLTSGICSNIRPKPICDCNYLQVTFNCLVPLAKDVRIDLLVDVTGDRCAIYLLSFNCHSDFILILILIPIPSRNVNASDFN